MDGNTEAPAKLPTLLEQIENAKSIDEFDKVEAGLSALEERFKGVVYNDISTKDGLAKAKADRVEIREVRYGVSAKAKGMKDPLNRLKKLIDGQAERIEARVLAVESPIDAQIKAEEARIEAEKERKRLEAETLRKARQDKIDAMRNAPVALTGASAEKIAVVLEEVRTREVTLDEFGDQAGAFMSAQNAAFAALTAMHAAAIVAEAQAAELAQLRAEAEARRKVEEAEAAGRAAKEAAERRAREVAEQKARDEAAAAAAKQAEADRIARDEAAAKLAAREKELADLRAKLEAMQAAQKPVEPIGQPAPLEYAGWAKQTRDAVLRQEGTPEPVDAKFTPPASDADPGDEAAPVDLKLADASPTRHELILVIADHWDVTDSAAEEWLVSTFGGAK